MDTTIITSIITTINLSIAHICIRMNTALRPMVAIQQRQYTRMSHQQKEVAGLQRRGRLVESIPIPVCRMSTHRKRAASETVTGRGTRKETGISIVQPNGNASAIGPVNTVEAN